MSNSKKTMLKLTLTTRDKHYIDVNSARNIKPWDDMGISRTTYYERKKRPPIEGVVS